MVARLKFTKMHGLGNDFMVVDAVNQRFDPVAAPIRAWAARHTGIGFDQLLVVEPPSVTTADFHYRIFNADGSEVEQCGNGARCFARFVSEKGLSNKHEMVVQTARGIIILKLQADGLVEVDMGLPRFAPSEIPFCAPPVAAQAVSHILTTQFGEVSVACVNMGNPHAVLLVDDVAVAPVSDLGAQIEGHDCFPQRVNVGFMQVLHPKHIRLRVYERGVGETQACGSGACAAVVAGVRLGRLSAGQKIEVDLPGGRLLVSWLPGGHVLMAGPAETVFDGELIY